MKQFLQQLKTEWKQMPLLESIPLVLSSLLFLVSNILAIIFTSANALIGLTFPISTALFFAIIVIVSRRTAKRTNQPPPPRPPLVFRLYLAFSIVLALAGITLLYLAYVVKWNIGVPSDKAFIIQMLILLNMFVSVFLYLYKRPQQTDEMP